MQKVEVKFGEWIEHGFNLYKHHFGILVLASLIALLLSSVTFGILAGPMMAGMVLIVMRLLEGSTPPPSATQVFRGFDYFLPSFLFIIVWGIALFVASFLLSIIPCIGPLVSLFIVYAAQAFLMFGLYLIVDKKMEFWPASMESINTVKTNFWPFLAFAAVASIIGSLGAIACGIGMIFTFPIQVCIIAIAYREIYRGAESPPAFTPGAAGDPGSSGTPREPSGPPPDKPISPGS
jgi:uncharacterized membrane protein